LFRTATNASIEFKRNAENKNITGDNEALIGFSSIEGILKNSNPDIIEDCLKQLPAKYQVLIRLRYLESLSYEEISEEIDAPLGTVKAQLHRARELLNDLLNNRDDDSDMLVPC
jgi:RNA polymerase sigma factor (sigma-70 family)